MDDEALKPENYWKLFVLLVSCGIAQQSCSMT